MRELLFLDSDHLASAQNQLYGCACLAYIWLPGSVIALSSIFNIIAHKKPTASVKIHILIEFVKQNDNHSL